MQVNLHAPYVYAKSDGGGGRWEFGGVFGDAAVSGSGFAQEVLKAQHERML